MEMKIMLEIFAVVAAVPCAKCLIVNLLIIMAGLWKKGAYSFLGFELITLYILVPNLSLFFNETGLKLC